MHVSGRFAAQVLLVVAWLAAVGCSTSESTQVPEATFPIATATAGPAEAPVVESQSLTATPEATSDPAVDHAASTAPNPAAAENEVAGDAAAGTKAAEAAARQESAPIARSEGVDDIRTVDFENGFSYQDAAFGDFTATVTNGEYANGEFGDEEFFWFAVTDVQFGDINGDGVEEAVVSTGYSGGGSGFFQNVRAFKLVDGVVTDAGIVYFGDRAFGGIGDLFIDDGMVSVLVFTNGEGSCCANEAALVRLVLGEHFLTEADTQQNLAWGPFNQAEERWVMQFLPNTNGAYVGLWGEALESSFSLEASAGQILTIETLHGPAPSEVVIFDTTTGERVMLDASAVLPSNAIYEVDVLYGEIRDQSTTLLVQIDAVPEAISWTPQAEQIVVTTDPLVHSSLTWPTFASETADATALAAANEALEDLVRGTDDLWIANVTDFPPLPDQQSTFELTYQVTYAADDLVSVHFGFYDYVCCRPHPDYGPLAAVLDLREGRLVDPTEILDLERSDEIHALWAAGLESQGQLPADLLDTVDLTATTFETVGIVREGIEFGTGRGAVAGGVPGTSVVLTFDELGDLVQPGFRSRVEA